MYISPFISTTKITFNIANDGTSKHKDSGYQRKLPGDENQLPYGGAENAGVENAGVEKAGAITYGKPKFEKKTFNCIYSFQFKDSR